MHIFLYKRNHLLGASGGAEKIMVTYANHFAEKGYQVTLATRDTSNEKLFFNLDNRVTFKHFHLSFSSVRRSIGKILSYLGLIDNFPYFNREFIVSNMLVDYCKYVKPDIVIVAGIQELIDFTAYGKRSYPVIMMMHSHPNAYFKKKRVKHYCNYINNAAAIQVLMPSYSAGIPKAYKGQIEVIGNPVPDIYASKTRENIIIYLGRIEPNKQQHMAIEAFAKIASSHLDWQVHFYGAVPHKEYMKKCQKLIKKYNLERQIYFKGITDKSAEKLQTAKICAFPSLFEGFSLSLTEAMSAGLPTIGFKSCTGVNELITDKENGFLVNDTKEFAEALEILISSDILREKMGKEAQKISSIYSMDNIIGQWEKLIYNILRG